jgi:hypothetical protein
MADDSIVHLAENSPEQVAYKLLEMIAFAEGKALRACAMGPKADRAYILSTYWECLKVVQGIGTEELDNIQSTRAPRPPLSADRPRTTLRKLGVAIGLLDCCLFGDRVFAMMPI